MEPIWNVEMKILSLISISDVTPSPNYWIQTNLKKKMLKPKQSFAFFFPTRQTEVYIGPITCLALCTYMQQTVRQGIAMIIDDSLKVWFSLFLQFEDEKSLFLVGCGQ